MQHQIIEGKDAFYCRCGEEDLSTGKALSHQKEYRKQRSQNSQQEEADGEQPVQNSNTKYYERHSGELWEKNRRKAKESDNYKCVDCGMTEEEHKKRDDMFGEGLHVHHKKPVKEFEDVEEAHKLSNLVTVCDEDHKKRENN